MPYRHKSLPTGLKIEVVLLLLTVLNPLLDEDGHAVAPGHDPVVTAGGIGGRIGVDSFFAWLTLGSPD
jgi:hypothetical protein